MYIYMCLFIDLYIQTFTLVFGSVFSITHIHTYIHTYIQVGCFRFISSTLLCGEAMNRFERTYMIRIEFEPA